MRRTSGDCAGISMCDCTHQMVKTAQVVNVKHLADGLKYTLK